MVVARTCLLAVVLMAGLGCGLGPGPEPKPAAAYADPGICAGCHADIARSYQLTGMGRSIGRAVPEQAGAQVRTPDRVYTIVASEGTLIQRRHQNLAGGPANVDERRADFAIGSGNHARSFLSRNREGKFVELPLTWYAAKVGYWAMSPGYERRDQEDFRRVVPDECLFCHSSSLQPLQAIDCQRCHGPGEAHAKSSGLEPIINPKRLSRDRQLDICLQCHLETTSSPLPNAIRRFERTVFSYRPGEPLSDYSLHFDHAPESGHGEKFEIAGAAYRLRQSACFRKSEMTCGTCHDPHTRRLGAAAAGCRQCHAAAHHAETSCIECHMPKRQTEDVPHVAMTDHFIQRRPAPSAARGAQPYQGEVVLYYPAALPRSAESEAYVAVAQVQHAADLARGIPRLEAAIAQLKPTRPEFYFELGKAYGKNGNDDAAIRWYRESLKRQTDFRPALKGLAASLLAQRKFAEAADLLAQAQAPDARMLTNYGQSLLELGRVDEAMQVLQRAVAANSDLPEPHDLLGLAWLRLADTAQAERQFREAIRLQPDLATAHANLGSLLAGRKDTAAASFHFTTALRIEPRSVETHRSYGFLLILMRAYDGAREEFETAARLDPARPQARLDLAELEQAAGRLEAAAAQYRLVLQQVPYHAEAHLGLGMLLQRGWRPAEAKAHLEQAARSSDAAVSQRATQALAAGH